MMNYWTGLICSLMRFQFQNIKLKASFCLTDLSKLKLKA